MYKYIFLAFFCFITASSILNAHDYTVSINIINLSNYDLNAEYNNSDGMSSWSLVNSTNAQISSVGNASNGLNSFSNVSEFNITWEGSNSYLGIQIYDTYLFLSTPGWNVELSEDNIIAPSIAYHTIFIPNPRTTDSTYHEWYFKDTTDLIFAGVNANAIGGGLEIIAPNGTYWNSTTGIVVLYPELVGSTMQTELNNFFTDNIIGTTTTDSQ